MSRLDLSCIQPNSKSVNIKGLYYKTFYERECRMGRLKPHPKIIDIRQGRKWLRVPDTIAY
jgi:hypothetical protein